MATTKPVYSNLYGYTGGYPGDAALGLDSTLPLLFETSLVTGSVMPTQGQVDSRMQTWLTAGGFGLAANYTGRICFDIESWLPAAGNLGLIQAAADKYIQLMGYLRNTLPLATMGYYSVCPRNVYFSALHYGLGDATDIAWRAENDAWAQVGAVCDYVAPSCYYFYVQEGSAAFGGDFIYYMKAVIAEARRVAPGKPCYAYLSTTCHNSNALWGGQLAQYRFMFKQLKCANDFADGSALFGVGGVWNANDEWARALDDFVTQTPAAVRL